ncbi:hypothetical protein I7I51_04477 [Histoplasma capsulatum]|uniref:Uncharacterized protein n=1 Tax=Ajellomyces capsulatus TaxID=5037 RepID=A0A8A1MAN9_AJECA|nr:hypothetical protein I7I51_04477 [Histoplasma capsulatum]
MPHRLLVALFEYGLVHNQASAPILQLLKRGDSYFVSSGTGKLLPASLSDLLSSWAGIAMVLEAGYFRDMRFSRSCPLSSSHLHITGEKISSPCTVTLSFSESHFQSITIPSEALNTWPGRILQQSSGGKCIKPYWEACRAAGCFYFTKEANPYPSPAWSGEGTAEYANSLVTAASTAILVLRDGQYTKFDPQIGNYGREQAPK